MSQTPGIAPERAKEMQERARERNLIIRQMKEQGSATVEELSKATGIDRSKLLRHLIALRQFGKVSIVGERNDQLLYALPEER